MKQIKTRCKNSNFDYKWFGESECPAADKYNDFCDDYTDFSICIEIYHQKTLLIIKRM